MTSKETGLLNEVTADRKSSRTSEVYRAALSVPFQPNSASFGGKDPESLPRLSKGEWAFFFFLTTSVRASFYLRKRKQYHYKKKKKTETSSFCVSDGGRDLEKREEVL